MDLLLLQNKLGHTFKNKMLLERALTHRSYGAVHNERLEFLGDSILNCVVASLLFERYDKVNEGDLSRLRANLVKQQALYEIAQHLGVSQFLRLGEGELKSGGFKRPSILADTLEALFGATYLDAGFDTAAHVIRAQYIPILDSVDIGTLGKDAKTLLQEYLQGHKISLPIYNVVGTHGAAHDQQFEIECLVPKLNVQVFGTGASRRAGEQMAAEEALKLVKETLTQAAALKRNKKQKQPTKQLKLIGIATVQPSIEETVEVEPETPVQHTETVSAPAEHTASHKAKKHVSKKQAANSLAQTQRKSKSAASSKRKYD